MPYITVEELIETRDRVLNLLSSSISVNTRVLALLNSKEEYAPDKLKCIADELLDLADHVLLLRKDLTANFPNAVRIALEVGNQMSGIDDDDREELRLRGAATFAEAAVSCSYSADMGWLSYHYEALLKAGYDTNARRRFFSGPVRPRDRADLEAYVKWATSVIETCKSWMPRVREEFARAIMALPTTNQHTGGPISGSPTQVRAVSSDNQDRSPGGASAQPVRKAIETQAAIARLLLEVHGAPPVNTRSRMFKRAEKRVRDARKRGDIELPCDEQAAREWARKQEFRTPLGKAEDDFDID